MYNNPGSNPHPHSQTQPDHDPALAFPSIFEGQNLSHEFSDADLADMSLFFGNWLQPGNSNAMDFMFQS